MFVVDHNNIEEAMKERWLKAEDVYQYTMRDK